MKYKIERNTVQETLILPLYSRKLCSELYPNLYRDETAVRLIDQIDYDFSVAEKNSRSLMQRFGALEVAMRQCDLAWEVRDYLKNHPCAAVVNLGCGLDNTGRACDNGRCKIYNLDFPDVIALRQQLLPAGEREQNIPCDLKDPAWFDKIDASGGAVFFASGVFYYFLTQQVRELVQGMADAFPGGVLVFDIAAMKATAALKAADRNPYSWNMEFYEYPDGSGYEGRFTRCGICVLMKELGLYDLTPALCHLDYTMSEAGGVTDFVRQYTLASGGPCCDCGYKKKG